MAYRFYSAHSTNQTMYLEVHFFLRKQASKNRSIEVRLKTPTDTTIRQATGIVITPDLVYFWQKKKMRFEINSKKENELRTLNQRLEKIVVYYQKIYDHRVHNQVIEGQEFSLTEILKKGLEKPQKSEHKQIKLIESYKEFIQQENTTQNWSKSRYHTAILSYNKLSQFLKHSGKQNITSNDFTYFDAKSYQNYMLETNLGIPSIKIYIAFLKRYFLYAFDSQIIAKNPVLNLQNIKQHTKNKKDRDLKYFLTIEMREKIAKAIEKELFDKAETKSAYIFLIQCETGLLYADYLRLNPSMVKRINNIDVITIRRIKSAKLAQIPMSANLKRLLEKFDWDLPAFEVRHYNRVLKRIAKICGIPFALSQKMARSTFAYHWINEKKLSIPAVAKMLGHSAFMTEKYYAEYGTESFLREIEDKI